MRSGTIAFFVGVLFCHGLDRLPDPLHSAAAAALALLAVRSRWLRLPGLCALGFAWALFGAQQALVGRIPPELEGRDVSVVATVVSIPRALEQATRFEALAVADPPHAGWREPRRLRLSWYRDAPPLAPGTRWTMTVRLRRPHGFRNPGGFDYERWLLSSRTDATGYVRQGSRLGAPVVSGPRIWLAQARGAIHRAQREVLGSSRFNGLVEALTVGVRDAITPGQWEVLRRTGTAHLMAISGLHVGLVAGFALLGTRAVLGRILPVNGGPSPLHAAAFVALASAAGYAALAGFATPTQRALAMLAVALVCLVRARRSPPSVGLCAALLAVLLLDPLVVLENGFWLSFGAVAALLLAMTGRAGASDLWQRWGHAQLVVAIGLAPLALAVFGAIPVSGIAANLIAVPWVGLVVVPLALAGSTVVVVSPDLGGPLLRLAAEALGLLWPFLSELSAAVPPIEPRSTPSGWSVALGGIGVAALLAPRGVPGRWLGGLCCLPLLAAAPSGPIAGELWLTVLDVGQGLSVVARTARHTLVYDTGPSYGPRFEAGGAVVAPYLRHIGRSTVDTLVLSHGDSDHVGGLAGLRRAISIKAVLANDEAGASACRTGVQWRWDGVDFRVLHPEAGQGWRGNDGSCVLAIRAGAEQVLLTGDAGRRAERAIVARHGPTLRSRVLVVAHHGSATSTSPALLRATAPDVSVVSAGYRNRYGMPAPAVLARLDAAGTRVLRTDLQGAVSVRLGREEGRVPVETERAARPRYWDGSR